MQPTDQQQKSWLQWITIAASIGYSGYSIARCVRSPNTSNQHRDQSVSPPSLVDSESLSIDTFCSELVAVIADNVVDAQCTLTNRSLLQSDSKMNRAMQSSRAQRSGPGTQMPLVGFFSADSDTHQSSDLKTHTIHQVEQLGPYSVRVIEAYVYPQGYWSAAACGYYAFTNAVLACTSCFSSSDSCQAAVPINTLLYGMCWNGSVLHSCIRQQRRELIQHAVELNTAKGIWTLDSTLRSMELQRVHMDYLTSFSQLAQGLPPNTLIAAPSISLSEMQAGVMTIEDVLLLQGAFDDIVQADSIVRAFICGAGSHWITIVVNKMDQHIELLYLESYNSRVYRKTETELHDYAHSAVYDSIERYIRQVQKNAAYKDCSRNEALDILENGRPWPHRVSSLEHKVRSYTHSLNDMQHAIDVIKRCSTGHTTVAKIYSDALIDSICSSFHPRTMPSSTLDALPAVQRETSFVGFDSWLKCGAEFCHPALLQGVMVPLLHALQSFDSTTQHSRDRLLLWLERMQQAMVDAGAIGSTNLAQEIELLSAESDVPHSGLIRMFLKALISLQHIVVPLE
jgi:hypothetical protein